MQASLGQKTLSFGSFITKDTIVLTLGLQPGSFGTVSTFYTALDFSGGNKDFIKNLIKAFLTGNIPKDSRYLNPRILMSTFCSFIGIVDSSLKY